MGALSISCDQVKHGGFINSGTLTILPQESPLKMRKKERYRGLKAAGQRAIKVIAFHGLACMRPPTPPQAINSSL